MTEWDHYHQIVISLQDSATVVKCTLEDSVISAAKASTAFLNAKVVGFAYSNILLQH